MFSIVAEYELTFIGLNANLLEILLRTQRGMTLLFWTIC